MKEAAGQTKDSRMKLLAGATTALSAKNAYDAIQAGQGTTINGKEGQIATGVDANGNVTSRDATAADQAGGVNLSISIGSSKSESKTVANSVTARGSSVSAGNDIAIRATGAGQDSDIRVQGSDTKAGNNIALHADDAIELLAAKNTAEQHSTNKSSSASVGFSIGTSGIGITVAASKGRGQADGSDVSWTNTHVEAGNQLSLNSGGDTTLKGALASGKEVRADIGGNLTIESLQDTSKYDSKQQNVGASVTFGVGISGSINASKSKIHSDFASVTEQSGIKAGDGGFDIRVKGNTDLKGAVVTSSAQAIEANKNRLVTGTLTTSDIENKAEYKAQSISIGAGYSSGTGVGKDQSGQAQTGGAQTPGSSLPSLNGFSAAPPVAMNAKGQERSTTQSGISAATIEITNPSAAIAKS